MQNAVGKERRHEKNIRDETKRHRTDGSGRELRGVAGGRTGRSRRRLFRCGAAQHAVEVGREFHAGRSGTHRRDRPRGGGEELPDGQYGDLRGRIAADARARRPRPCGGGRRRDRFRPVGDPLRAPHRDGGAYLHAVQPHEQRGGEILLAVGRRGGAGARTVARPDRPHRPRDRRAADMRPFGRSGAHRDVRPRRAVHGRFGQVLPVASRDGVFGQPGRLPPDLPPQIYAHRRGDGRAARRRGAIPPFAQRPLHDRLPRPLRRRRRARAQNRRACPRCGVRQTGGGVLRPRPAGDGDGRIYARTGCGAQRGAGDGLQPRLLAGLLCRCADGRT